ncbi:MAG: hypothetical protein N838_26010 [Thiohalocapsa sp. PB-PSB1]|jgi:hypothetical protein|nr:MAG: hypothetical protein N838_26010 [Thiohalocapsa sp. PB-PSB1]
MVFGMLVAPVVIPVVGYTRHQWIFGRDARKIHPRLM